MKTQLEDLNHKWRGLLETIRALQASVGDDLNEDEVTRLLRESALPIEAGFRFLSFSDGVVTLTVPRQELANWYPERGWIMPEKEEIARAIAKKYELSLLEPPDVNSSALYPRPDSPGPHHHLELSNRRETVVVAHPQYLKIRLFSRPSGFLHTPGARIPLLLSPELLEDLSFLYKSESVLGAGKASLREDDSDQRGNGGHETAKPRERYGTEATASAKEWFGNKSNLAAKLSPGARRTRCFFVNALIFLPILQTKKIENSGPCKLTSKQK